MYWVDNGGSPKRIRRANLTGTSPQTLVSTGLSGPVAIRLDVSAGKMYWTDEGNDTIKRADLSGSSVQTLVSSGLNSPEGLALDLVARKMYWTDRGNTIKRPISTAQC
jgi:low density lipoprotein receptor-related protein 5/6